MSAARPAAGFALSSPGMALECRGLGFTYAEGGEPVPGHLATAIKARDHDHRL